MDDIKDERITTEEAAVDKGKNVKSSADAKERKHFPAVLSAVLLIAVIGGAVMLGAKVIIPFARYLEGRKAMAERDYQSAVDIFTGLGDLYDCEDLIIECRYDLAVMDFNEGNYQSARSTFEELGDIYDCQDLIKRIDFDHAVELFEGGYIRRAIDELHELGDYEGVSETITYMTGIFREKDNFKYFASVQRGDQVIYGYYEGTPLEWTILEADPGTHQVLMICDTYLCDMPYDDPSTRLYDADAIKWLESDFRMGAFTGEERRFLRYSENDDLTSMFYFMSLEEIQQYFPSEEDRAYGHDYWLRPASGEHDMIPYVTSDGRIEAAGTSCNDELAVRPVTRLYIDSSYWYY